MVFFQAHFTFVNSDPAFENPSQGINSRSMYSHGFFYTNIFISFFLFFIFNLLPNDLNIVLNL